MLKNEGKCDNMKGNTLKRDVWHVRSADKKQKKQEVTDNGL